MWDETVLTSEDVNRCFQRSPSGSAAKSGAASQPMRYSAAPGAGSQDTTASPGLPPLAALTFDGASARA